MRHGHGLEHGRCAAAAWANSNGEMGERGEILGLTTGKHPPEMRSAAAAARGSHVQPAGGGPCFSNIRFFLNISGGPSPGNGPYPAPTFLQHGININNRRSILYPNVSIGGMAVLFSR